MMIIDDEHGDVIYFRYVLVSVEGEKKGKSLKGF